MTGTDHGRLQAMPVADGETWLTDARACGLTDMVRSGWCNAAAGELFPGFAVSAQDAVLDAGCGDGLAVMFCAQQGCEVTFCDVDPAKVRSLAGRLEERGFRAFHGIVGAGHRLPLRDASMSRVIATEVLEHVEDPEAMLRELVRVGRPGALYLISVPDADSERFQQPFVDDTYFRPPNHVRIVEPGMLERMAEAAGLQVQGRGQWGFYWFMWMSFYWAARHEADASTPMLDRIQPPYHPLLRCWSETWSRFLRLPGSDAMHEAFNRLMPKSRVIVARRPEA